MTHSAFSARVKWERLFLLALLLLAYARLVWGLGEKDLWLDESLSLQRIEGSWWSLLKGEISLTDGQSSVATLDQHPFGYFVLLRLATELLGKSEFALRYPSVLAATLLVPAAWVLGRRLLGQGLAPPSAPYWATLLVAINPYYLWYGQEARPYALLPMLALLSTYALLKWRVSQGHARESLYLVAYLFFTVALLTTHYYAMLLLPAQMIVVFALLAPANPKRAAAILAALTAAVAIPALIGALLLWDLPPQSHFSAITLPALLRDLLNAFSLGLSVEIDRVWAFDVLFAALAICGAAYGMWTRYRLRAYGWVLAASTLLPVLLMAAINLVHPAYSGARHISMISGIYLLLVGLGVGWLWQRSKVAALSVMLILVAVTGYSTLNYFTVPEYAKEDLQSYGEYFGENVEPGDLVLLRPAANWRLFHYYVPLDLLPAGSVRVMPPWGLLPREAAKNLGELTSAYRRVWLLTVAPEDEIDSALQSSMFRAVDRSFRSSMTRLEVQLYLREPPVLDPRELPAIQHPLSAAFGPQIRLLGYEIGRSVAPGRSIPVTLFWQALEPIKRQYKYRLTWVAVDEAGEEYKIWSTEREPYDGALPTTLWPPQGVVREYSHVAGSPPGDHAGDRLSLRLLVYDAQTLEPLPVTRIGDRAVESDEPSIVLPW